MVTVEARYLNGDDVLIPGCTTIDDARVKFAALHDRLAPEVLFFVRDGTIEEQNCTQKILFPNVCQDDSPPILPVSAVFKHTPLPYTQEFLAASVLLHARSGDSEGVRRAMSLCADRDEAEFLCARTLLYHLRDNDEPASSELVELLSDYATPSKINIEDELSWSALDVACFQHPDTVIIQIILDAKANVAHVDRRGRSAVARLSYQGKNEILELLLSRDNDAVAVNLTDRTGCAPLCLAAFQGHTKVCQQLLQHKANVNHSSNTAGMTALTQAACAGHTAVVELLLEHGADCEIVSKNGRPALMSAALEGRFDVVRALLKHGADVHATTSEGCTALGFAALRCHAALCQLLIKHGAHVNSLIQGGSTPLMMAARRKNGVEAISVLLNAKADVNLRNMHGWQALCIATLNGNDQIVRKLRECGAHCEQAKNRVSHCHHDAHM